MGFHSDVGSLLKQSLPEYLAVAKLAMSRTDGKSGEYGYPAAAMLLMIASAIGAYYEKDSTFTVNVDGTAREIRNPSHHLFILNSGYYGGQALSADRIARIYECLRGPLIHN